MFPTSSSPSAHGRWQNISSPNLAGSSSNINKPRKSQLVLSAKSSSSTVNNAQSLENMVLRGEAAHLSVKGFGNSSIKASLDALNQYRQQQQLRLIEKRLSNSSCSQIDHDRSSQHSSCEHLGFESEERSSASNTSSLGSLEKLKHGANTETFTTKRLIDDGTIALAASMPPQFTANLHQAAIFNEIHPQPHEHISPPSNGGSHRSINNLQQSLMTNTSRFVITQLYSSPFENQAADIKLLRKIVFNLLLNHPILRCSFTRNDNIIDADVHVHVEGALSFNNTTKTPGNKSNSNGDLSSITDEQVQTEILAVVERLAENAIHILPKAEADNLSLEEMIKLYGKASVPPGSPVTFDIVLFFASELVPGAAENQDSNLGSWQWLFIYPALISDEFTAHLLSTTILELYANKTANYHRLDRVDFVPYAVELDQRQSGQQANLYKEAVCAYRDHLIDLEIAKNINTEDIDKAKLRDQIENHKAIRTSIDRQLIEIKQKIDDKKVELQNCTSQRRLMDLQSIDDLKSSTTPGSDGNSRQRKNYMTYIDSVTGETIIILNHAKEALIQSVLGDEATEDNIMPLLRKHKVSEDSIQKLDAANMDLERFLQCTMSDLDARNIDQGERRQLQALVEYVRGRVKECMEEQSKVKFGLERKIQKLERELNNIVEIQLPSKQLEWDKNEQKLIHLSTTLNPPLIKRMVPLASIPYDRDSKYSLACSVDRLSIRPNNTASEEQLTEKRIAEVDALLQDHAIRNQRLLLSNFQNAFFPIVLPANFKQMTQDFSLCWRTPGSPSDYRGSQSGLSSSTRPNVNFVTCLASFAVLVRHMTGHSKFAIGYHRRLSTDPLGPTAAVVPLKIDMSKKDLTLGDMCAQLSRSLTLQWEKSNDISLPLTALREEITRQLNSISVPMSNIIEQITASQVSLTSSSDENICAPLFFPIQFEFWPRDQVIRLQKQGFDVERWATGQTAGFQWSVNQEENFDLKLIVVEAADAKDSITMGIWYKRNIVEFERVVRWADRLLSILVNLDYSNHKLTLSHIVGRFYQRVFTKSSTNSLAATE